MQNAEVLSYQKLPGALLFLLSALLSVGSVYAEDELSESKIIADKFTEFEGADETDWETDPWEPFNRSMFDFNEQVDKYVLKPVATVYEKVTPRIVNRGVSNFFGNIRDFSSIFYSVLQLKGRNAAIASSRVMFNTTFGVLGFFDVASSFGLENHKEDMGQTLAYWGVPRGNYMVLPFLGPSSVRDFAGRAISFMEINPLSLSIDDEALLYSIYGLRVIDFRAGLLFSENLVSGDRYAFMRNFYFQYRDFLINDGKVHDPFSQDDDYIMEDF